LDLSVPDPDFGLLVSVLVFIEPGPDLLLGLARVWSASGLERMLFFLGLERLLFFLGLARAESLSGLLRTDLDSGLLRAGVADLESGLLRAGEADLESDALEAERVDGALEAGAFDLEAGAEDAEREGLELGLLLRVPLLEWKWQPPSAMAKMATLAAGLSVRWMSFIVSSSLWLAFRRGAQKRYSRSRRGVCQPGLRGPPPGGKPSVGRYGGLGPRLGA